MFSIGLDGEYTVSGEIFYEDNFYSSIVLSIDDCEVLPTKIAFMFDEEFVIAPPLGTFEMGKNLDVLISTVGNEVVKSIENGKRLKVKLVADDFGYYTENHSEPFYGVKIVNILDAMIDSKPVLIDSSSNNDSSKSTDPMVINKEALIESSGNNYYKFKSNTNVYFDIDQDGINEKINYSIDNDNLKAKLIIDGYNPIEIETFQAETSWFQIINFTDKYGTNMNMIGLFDYGPSADPVTTLYSIIAPNGTKSFVSVGTINAQLVDKSKYINISDSYDFSKEATTEYLAFSEDFIGKAFLIENEGIEAPVYLSINIPQVWYGRTLFTYYSTYCSLVDSSEKYDTDYKTYSVLSVTNNVKAYANKDINSEFNFITSGQNVLLYSTDNKDWVAMEAEDGTKGWVHVNDISNDNFDGFVIFG